MLIGIDAGHGRYTSGKRCDRRYDSYETREWVLNSRVAGYVQQYLSEYKNVSTIRLDDTTGNTDVPLSTRCRNANRQKCELVVSIHHNAGGGNGLETYVWNGSQLPQRTVDIAQTIHNACISATGQKNRGLKRADFAMVRDTYMDACLVEGGFMDNPEDTPRILTDDFARKYARGIANGIAQYYGLKGGNTPTPTPTPSPTPTPTGITGDITYQSYDNKKGIWLPEVINDKDYAGNIGNSIGGIRAKCKYGTIYIQTHVKGGNWLSVINSSTYSKNNKTNGNSYSGIYGKAIDGVKVWSSQGHVDYRVHIKGGGWLPWVHKADNTSNGYAGIYGKEIDAIQMK